MMLGNQECDADTAYFLKHGHYPPPRKKCQEAEATDIEFDDEKYREFQESNYFEWQYETTYKYAIYR